MTLTLDYGMPTSIGPLGRHFAAIVLRTRACIFPKHNRLIKFLVCIYQTQHNSCELRLANRV